jgi:hypothetical protein
VIWRFHGATPQGISQFHRYLQAALLTLGNAFQDSLHLGTQTVEVKGGDFRVTAF